MVTQAPTSLLLGPEAPAWAQRFVLRLQGYFVPSAPTGPQRVWATTFANLPPAKDWLGAVAWVTDKGKLCVSNGAAWVTTDGGPP